MRVLLFSLLTAAGALAETPYELQSKSIAAQQRAILEQARGSIETQTAAVRKQARLPVAAPQAFFVIASPDPVNELDSDCGAMSPMRAQGLVDNASRRSGVSADLLRAVIQQESAFRPCAVSNKGARGLMQLMPSTIEQFGVGDPFDPEQNVAAGASLLKQLMDRYSGDLNRVLGAYNAGPARVDAAAGVPFIPETMNYVEKILGNLSSGHSAVN